MQNSFINVVTCDENFFQYDAEKGWGGESVTEKSPRKLE
jgi:hypothetical protein